MPSLTQEALDVDVCPQEVDDAIEFVEVEVVVPLHFDAYAKVQIEEDGDVLWALPVPNRPCKAVR